MIASNGWYAECDLCDTVANPAEIAESPQAALSAVLNADPSWVFDGSELICPDCLEGSRTSM